MFSIIIPLYNKSRYICRAVDSVLAQSFQNYEIIVINDGSTDGGDQLVEKKYSSQIRLIHQPNQGVSSARNKGIRTAKFGYISFLDADDMWHPDYLLSVRNAISENPTTGIIGTSYTSVHDDHILATGLSPMDGDKDVPPAVYYSAKNYFRQAIHNTLIWTSATTIKKDFFEIHAGFDPKLKFGEDLDVWFRAILFYKKLLYIPSILAYYSKEDASAATRKIHLLEHTLIPKILREDYLNVDQTNDPDIIREFERFKIKWIYLRLYPIYKKKENIYQVRSLITKLPFRYYFLGIIYRIPFEILHKLSSNRLSNKILVKYIEFCFRYIYK